MLSVNPVCQHYNMYVRTALQPDHVELHLASADSSIILRWSHVATVSPRPICDVATK